MIANNCRCKLCSIKGCDTTIYRKQLTRQFQRYKDTVIRSKKTSVIERTICESTEYVTKTGHEQHYKNSIFTSTIAIWIRDFVDGIKHRIKLAVCNLCLRPSDVCFAFHRRGSISSSKIML